MSKERWVVSELEKRYGVDITRRWLAKLANLQLMGDSMADDIDRLADLLDVLLTDPQDGDILQYEAASQRWKNKVVSGGSGNPVVTQATTILTPEMIRASNVTIIELAPAPGAGKAYIDATSLWIFGAGFTAYGGVFAPNLALGEDLAQTTVVFEQAGINSLYQSLTGGAAGNVLGTWFGGMVQQSWSDPLSLLDNCPYYFSTSAAPTGGAGDITVVSAMTTLTLP